MTVCQAMFLIARGVQRLPRNNRVRAYFRVITQYEFLGSREATERVQKLKSVMHHKRRQMRLSKDPGPMHHRAWPEIGIGWEK